MVRMQLRGMHGFMTKDARHSEYWSLKVLIGARCSSSSTSAQGIIQKDSNKEHQPGHSGAWKCLQWVGSRSFWG